MTDFYVRTDRKEPVLDVSFDGVHIINGDIVAANPFILIDVRDENEFLLLDDPEKIMVSLIDPNGNEVEYNIASPELSFEAATDLNNNQAKISLEPLLSQDGDYTLVVQAADASGNISGDNAYEVTFRVILRESVSNVLNYPNPFSTSTQFVFTLTGNELPDYMKIQIMTVSGKVVREITMDELAPTMQEFEMPEMSNVYVSAPDYEEEEVVASFEEELISEEIVLADFNETFEENCLVKCVLCKFFGLRILD